MYFGYYPRPSDRRYEDVVEAVESLRNPTTKRLLGYNAEGGFTWLSRYDDLLGSAAYSPILDHGTDAKVKSFAYTLVYGIATDFNLLELSGVDYPSSGIMPADIPRSLIESLDESTGGMCKSILVRGRREKREAQWIDKTPVFDRIDRIAVSLGVNTCRTVVKYGIVID